MKWYENLQIKLGLILALIVILMQFILGFYLYNNYKREIISEFKYFSEISYNKNSSKDNIKNPKELIKTNEKDKISKLNVYLSDVYFSGENIQNKLSNKIFELFKSFIIINFIIICLIIIVIRQLVIKPISKITKTIKNFKNNLTIKIPNVSNDEIGELATCFNHLIQDLYNTIKVISDILNNINHSISEISTLVENQASFSSQLSSSIVEISSTMEQFTISVKQIAENSGSVVDVAKKSLVDTKNGASEVEASKVKMNEISLDNQKNLKEIVSLGEKSKEITKIMEMINDIANTTKLIAFNASLEASSAGESGSRFGIVATEIRGLTNSVVESTDEIEDKINEILSSVNHMVISSEKSSKGIKEGLDYSTKASMMLSSIVGGAEETTNSAKQIFVSTQQLQNGSDQVLSALKDIEGGAQVLSNALTKIRDTSRTLSQQSDDVKSRIENFNLLK